MSKHFITKSSAPEVTRFIIKDRVQASIATTSASAEALVNATVGDLEGKRGVEPAPTVTRCNAASISREHNTSPGLWRDSKGQHDASCVLTPWAEGCQSIKHLLNV